MTIYKDTSASNLRHDVLCRMDELTEDSGTYTFNDKATAAMLGDNSSVIVTDSPGLLLFYNAATGELKPW